jgi:predicted N-acyltransferase
VPRIADIPASMWDACANPDAATFNPFLAHGFLAALEASGSVGKGTGWTPAHIVLGGEANDMRGVMPAYLKSHSQGEYVFDSGWANAYMQAGGRYYPKLQCAVPFTPVPGRRLLVLPGHNSEADERRLANAAIAATAELGASSLHITFLDPPATPRLERHGFLIRTDQQYHWQNRGYATFDDFLAALSSRKRKTVRKERATALAAGLDIRLVTGKDIREADWDAMYAFYMDTGSRKWGRPYLNRDFFSHLGQRMSERCLLVLAERSGRTIAGALNMIGGDCLYGRYWGAIEPVACLHFEVCYYQAIEYAIRHRLSRVEAGAQGEHKLARGYMPTTTYSAHHLRDPGLARAVARYLDVERREVAHMGEALRELAPYRRDVAFEDHD